MAGPRSLPFVIYRCQSEDTAGHRVFQHTRGQLQKDRSEKYVRAKTERRRHIRLHHTTMHSHPIQTELTMNRPANPPGADSSHTHVSKNNCNTKSQLNTSGDIELSYQICFCPSNHTFTPSTSRSARRSLEPVHDRNRRRNNKQRNSEHTHHHTQEHTQHHTHTEATLDHNELPCRSATLSP